MQFYGKDLFVSYSFEGCLYYYLLSNPEPLYFLGVGSYLLMEEQKGLILPSTAEPDCHTAIDEANIKVRSTGFSIECADIYHDLVINFLICAVIR